MSNDEIDTAEMQKMADMAIPSCVLVGGLGLGILPRLLANRKDIHEITVIEKSESVIRGSVVMSDKIVIIHSDFNLFIKNNNLLKFDCALVDIWPRRRGHEDEMSQMKKLPIPSFVWGIDA